MRRWRSSFSKKNSSEDSRRSYAGRTKAPGPRDRRRTRWGRRKKNRRNGNRGTRTAQNVAKSCNGIPIFGRRNTMMWTTVRGFTDCCSSITAGIKPGKRDEGEMLSYPVFVGYRIFIQRSILFVKVLECLAHICFLLYGIKPFVA